MQSLPPRLLLTALCAVLFMSMVPVLVRSVSANEITIGITRLAIALLLISPIVFFKSALKNLNKRQWIGLFTIGMCFGLHWLSYFYSIKLATASLGAIAVSTFGIHLLLLNWIFKGQRIRPFEWLTVIACFIGCLLITPEFDLENQVTIGLIAGVFSGLLYAALPLLHQRIVEVPTLTRTWGQFTFAALFFIPWLGASNWNLSSGDWYRLLSLGIFCTVVAHTLWVKASTELPPVITGVVYYIYIPCTMMMSWYFLEEQITVKMAGGAALIIAANIAQALYRWQQHQNKA